MEKLKLLGGFSLVLTIFMLILSACATTEKAPPARELTIEEMAAVPLNHLSERDISRFLNATRGRVQYRKERQKMLKELLVSNRKIPMPDLVDAIKSFNHENMREYFVLASCQYFRVIMDGNGGMSRLRPADREFLKTVYTWSLEKLGRDAHRALACSSELLVLVEPDFLK